MASIYLAKTARHINDGQQVLFQGRFRIHLVLIEAVVDVVIFANRFLATRIKSLRRQRIDGEFLDRYFFLLKMHEIFEKTIVPPFLGDHSHFCTRRRARHTSSIRRG